MRRHELSDEQWAKLAPLLPPQRPATGRPAKDHRTIINGILWLLKTSAPWRDLPERFGPWRTVASRFYRWQKAGVWNRVLAALQQDGAVDWSVHFIDGTSIRAHQHAAGAKGGRTSKPSAEVAAASPPKSTSAATGLDARSPSPSRQGSSTKPRSSLR
jgi:transposase